jgi:hypothetical protein
MIGDFSYEYAPIWIVKEKSFALKFSQCLSNWARATGELFTNFLLFDLGSRRERSKNNRFSKDVDELISSWRE